MHHYQPLPGLPPRKKTKLARPRRWRVFLRLVKIPGALVIKGQLCLIYCPTPFLFFVRGEHVQKVRLTSPPSVPIPSSN